MKELDFKQKLVAKYYVDENSETRGSKYKSYAKAYNRDITNKKDKEYCQTSSSRLFKKDQFRLYLNPKIDKTIGLTDKDVDGELKRLIFQQDNLGTKMQAIKEYNKLRGRYLFEFPEEGTEPEEEGLTVVEPNVKVITVKFAG